MATLTFRQIKPRDVSTWPRPRQGHASVFHKGCLYVFGGRVQGSGRIYVNDLWKYDPTQNTWEELIAVDLTHMPCKRHNHSCIVKMDAIYVFGGQTTSDKYLGDLWRFDLNTRQWSELATSQPRHSHSALKHERTMIVFGGRTGLKPAVYSNDILSYDLDSNTWSSLYLRDDQNPAAVEPHPRSYTSLVPCGQYFVVYGGYWWDGKEHYFDDTFTRHINQEKSDKSPRQQMRRSSTTRSIGARSDFGTSVNGDGPLSIGNSVEAETAERERERREADVHTANYVSEQLSRVRSNQSADFETGDEYEAQLDGQ